MNQFCTALESKPLLCFHPCPAFVLIVFLVILKNRDKRNLPFTPILASVNRLIRYHLGTVAKGSFIITLVKIPRMILMYIHSQLKGKVRGSYVSGLGVCTPQTPVLHIGKRPVRF